MKIEKYTRITLEMTEQEFTDLRSFVEDYRSVLTPTVINGENKVRASLAYINRIDRVLEGLRE